MSKSLPAVITTLERAGGFASAQEVFQLMRKQGKSTGLATVYRALQKAATENSVDVIRKDDGEALYRLCATGHHHHSQRQHRLRHHFTVYEIWRTLCVRRSDIRRTCDLYRPSHVYHPWESPCERYYPGGRQFRVSR